MARAWFAQIISWSKYPWSKLHAHDAYVNNKWLPHVLAEEVCLSVCLYSAGWTVGPTDINFCTRIKDYHDLDNFKSQGNRSKVRVIPVFSLVSEKVKATKVKGRRSSSKVIGQGQSCMGSLVPHRLVGGVACGHFHFVFLLICFLKCQNSPATHGD